MEVPCCFPFGKSKLAPLNQEAVVSVLEQAYAEKGNDEKTSQSLHDLDAEVAAATKSSLLFGEILPSGVTKALEHLDTSKATVLFDLGMGMGRLAMQAFLQYPGLKKVVGVELAYTRTLRAHSALRQLAKINPKYQLHEPKDARTLAEQTWASITEGDAEQRMLELRRGNLFECDCTDADVVICETKITEVRYPDLAAFLCKLKRGTRVLTYENLDRVFVHSQVESPFQAINSQDDRYVTTWSMDTGHHFFLWVRT